MVNSQGRVECLRTANGGRRSGHERNEVKGATSRAVEAIGFPGQSMDPAMRQMKVVRKVVIAALI